MSRRSFIEGALLKFVSYKALQIGRLRAFGSDGASVMTGRLSGVRDRLTRHLQSKSDRRSML